jgi:hypothetical protein
MKGTPGRRVLSPELVVQHDIAQPMPVDGPSASGRPPCLCILQCADTDLFGPGKDVDSSMRDGVVHGRSSSTGGLGVDADAAEERSRADGVGPRRGGADVCLEVQVRS